MLQLASGERKMFFPDEYIGHIIIFFIKKNIYSSVIRAFKNTISKMSFFTTWQNYL